MESSPQNTQPIAPQKTNDLAVASLVLSILGTFIPLLLSIPAIICGHKARANFRKGIAVSGSGIALAGLIIGYVMVVFWIIMLTQTLLFYHLAQAEHQWRPHTFNGTTIYPPKTIH